jgi:hypothetical protein
MKKRQQKLGIVSNDGILLYNMKSSVLSMMSNTYRPIVGNIYSYSDKMHISNETIEMINSNFDTYYCIHQKRLTKILQKKYPFLNPSYDPDDNYHAIKAYWPCTSLDDENARADVRVFIAIFRTGSILMSGAKHADQLNRAYAFINSVLKQHYDEIWIPTPTE